MRAVALVLAMLLVSATGAAARGTAAVPKRIALPAGFQPEGIATAGGRGAMLVKPQSGRAAIGVDVDSGRLFVAGGPTGKAFVYDARTGGSLAALQLATGRDTFVNDVVVTRRAAWFTDSSNDVRYRVPLAADGRPGAQTTVRAVKLRGDFRLEGGFNANGIDATSAGTLLVIVQSNTGRLFTVDPATGAAPADRPRLGERAER
jgi:sugar lactone lactonase YvrE